MSRKNSGMNDPKSLRLFVEDMVRRLNFSGYFYVKSHEEAQSIFDKIYDGLHKELEAHMESTLPSSKGPETS